MHREKRPFKRTDRKSIARSLIFAQRTTPLQNQGKGAFLPKHVRSAPCILPQAHTRLTTLIVRVRFSRHMVVVATCTTLLHDRDVLYFSRPMVVVATCTSLRLQHLAEPPLGRKK